MNLDLDEEIKLAIRLECAKRDCTPSQLVVQLLTEHCKESVRIAQQHIQRPKK